MPIQGTGSVQEQSSPEQGSTLVTLKRGMVLLGLLRFASLRSAPHCFRAAFAWFGVASPFSSCPRLVPFRFVSSAPRFGSIKAGVTASPAIGGLES